MMQADKELVLEAVKQNGLVLVYASPDLKNDFDVVYQAVRNRGQSLNYASYELRNNELIVL